MSVRRCQQEIDSREFAEWLAYRRLHGPLPARLLPYLAAQIEMAIRQGAGQKGVQFDRCVLPFWGDGNEGPEVVDVDEVDDGDEHLANVEAKLDRAFEA